MDANSADVIHSPGTPPGPPDPAEAVVSAVSVAEVFRQHHPELVRLALLVVGDLGTAEDVVQDAFEQLHRHWRSLRKESAAFAYARSAVLNRSRSVLRRRAVARRHEPALAPRHEEQPDRAIALEERSALLDAFRALPRRQREVLALRYYLDLSVSDAAAVLRISEGAVRSTTSRGLAALARILPREHDHA